ncbi:MAG: hypothetical protein Q6358_10485 [Candidatus Brocadiales bacterium]|nr:hypothetical protein [Candidatus Brocadiales bacterium]
MDKYGETTAEALELDDCFSSTGGMGEQVAEFWVNYVSGTAYIESTYIKMSFSGNAEIQVSNANHRNQKRDNALRHYPFFVFA